MVRTLTTTTLKMLIRGELKAALLGPKLKQIPSQ